MTCIFEHVFLWVAPCLFKVAFLNKAAKFKDNAKKKKKKNEKKKKKQQYSYFRYIFLFQFAIINDQPNTFEAFALIMSA